MPYSRCAFSKTQTVLLTVDADANGVFSGKEAVILRLVTCPYLIRRQPSIMYLSKIKLCIVYIDMVTVCLTLTYFFWQVLLYKHTDEQYNTCGRSPPP